MKSGIVNLTKQLLATILTSNSSQALHHPLKTQVRQTMA
jgi:hypothetical protein